MKKLTKLSLNFHGVALLLPFILVNTQQVGSILTEKLLTGMLCCIYTMFQELPGGHSSPVC